MYLRQVFLIVKRHAGHSKWQNIRHVKAEKDSQRSLLFVKLAQRIKVAIQENGNNCNPDHNVHLGQAIEYARSKDMPVATIQNVIKSMQGNKDGAQPFRFSVRGPRGSVLLVTALAASMKKTRGDIMFVLKKTGGMLAEQSLESQFEKKGVVVASPPPNIENIEETSVEHAIEVGAEEVSPSEDKNKLTFTCGLSEVHKVRKKLEELKYNVEESKITYLPKMTVSLNDSEMELMSNIIAALEKLPEVSEINDNIE